MGCGEQADASDREIAHAAADAAEAAFDEVANAELAHRLSTQGGEAASAFAVSDAVLHQRTYFVPTMVRVSCRLDVGTSFTLSDATPYLSIESCHVIAEKAQAASLCLHQTRV